MSNFTSDIDAILAEFSSYSSTLSDSAENVEEVSGTVEAITDIFNSIEETPRVPEVEPIQAEPAVFQPEQRETQYDIPLSSEPDYPEEEYPESESGFPQPVFSNELFSFDSEPVKPHNPTPAPVRRMGSSVSGHENRQSSLNIQEKQAHLRFDPEKLGFKNAKTSGEKSPKSIKAEKKQLAMPKIKVKPEPKAKAEPKIKVTVAPKEDVSPKFESTALKAVRGVIGMVFAAISVLVLCWVMLNIHPESGASGSPSTKSSLDLVGDLGIYLNNTASDALGDLAYIKKIYTINESDTVAPRPDPGKFGSTTDPAVIQQVIDSASALLEGQELAWDPNVDFFPGSDIKYYYDDTILVIAWKELIEGKCCTCAEIKIAHGSQLRRKLADNTYGSSVQLKATEMANEVNSVIAINGDFYAFRDLGITAYQRQLYRCNPAQVDSCFFTASGDMLFSYAGELMDFASAQQFIDDNDVTFAVAFGPVLVDNGQLRQIDSYPIGEIHRTYSRASIGLLDDLHYFLMTINYEGDCTVTSTINQSAQFMYDKGCQKAYALDGGQTSVMVMQGQTVNKVDWGSERIMSDIIYFATAIPEQEVA